MFRSRFAEAFPGKLANFGPQDLEFGVIDSHPSPQVENLLCALLALLLNRKKPIEYVDHLIPAREGRVDFAKAFFLDT
jgi:hypothetical protein